MCHIELIIMFVWAFTMKMSINSEYTEEGVYLPQHSDTGICQLSFMDLKNWNRINNLINLINTQSKPEYDPIQILTGIETNFQFNNSWK